MNLKHQMLVAKINRQAVRRHESRGQEPLIWIVIGLLLILLLVVRR